MKKILVIVSLLLISLISISINASSSFVKINDTVEIDNDVIITLNLENIEYDNFTFKLYSSESLETINATDVNLTNYNDEVTFDYCINCSNLKTIDLKYKLPSSISINDKITFYAKIINKNDEEEFVDYRTIVTVINKPKEEEKNDEKPKLNNNSNINKKTNIRKNTSFKQSNSGFPSSFTSKNSSVTKYYGSSNNYLKSLSIKGYKLNKSFKKERLTYFITVPNNVKSLNIKATKDNSNSTINISGNSKFSVGLNKVLITVTSQDGRVKNYRIYVTRLDSGSNEE